jgi:hypothetical protein
MVSFHGFVLSFEALVTKLDVSLSILPQDSTKVLDPRQNNSVEALLFKKSLYPRNRGREISFKCSALIYPYTVQRRTYFLTTTKSIDKVDY